MESLLDLVEAVKAGRTYCRAIEQRSQRINAGTETMSLFNSVEGEDLDVLFERWLELSEKALPF